MIFLDVALAACFAVLISASVSEGSLIHHWTFDDGTGSSTAADSVGGNTGTLTNMPSATAWVSGKIGSALTFPAGNDYVIAGSSISTSRTSSSFSAWINTSTTGDRKVISYGGDHPLQVFGSQARMCYGGCTGGVGPTITNSTWHLMAVVASGSGRRIYVDGVDVGGLGVGSGSATGAPNFGRYSGGGYDYIGLIDDPAIWSNALSPTEVLAIYNLGNDVSLNYNATNAQDLFDEHTAAGGGSGVAIGGLTWTYAAGLTPGTPGTLSGSGSIRTLYLTSTTGVQSVPEPSGVALTALGLLGLMGWRRRFWI